MSLESLDDYPKHLHCFSNIGNASIETIETIETAEAEKDGYLEQIWTISS